MLNSFVIQQATTTLGANLAGYIQDSTYGTSTCPVQLYQIIQKWMNIIAANNGCQIASPEQLQCFYNALTKSC